ncbi:MAG: hypothetical protein K2Q18_02185 [Bdellovibrionales bacterium]|nr:hypothetical protein [Bdellovibrionales bacterium]
MKVIFKLLILSQVFSIAASYSADNIYIPAIPSSKEINEAVTPPEINCNSEQPVSEDDLNKCYKAHPFFIEILMLISDSDFRDQEKSIIRKKKLAVEVSINKQSVEACLRQLIQYANEQNNPENLKYVQYRLSEISSVIKSNI